MKAKDLMIGDWVMRGNFAREPMQVYRICPDINTVHMDFNGMGIAARIDHINPIPLTPEILEKNGFHWDGSGRRSMCYITPFDRTEKEIRYNIYVGLKHKTIEAFAALPVERTPGWRKSNKVYLEVCGCYVHELQHALRLCGIEKEIEL